MHKYEPSQIIWIDSIVKIYSIGLFFQLLTHNAIPQNDTWKCYITLQELTIGIAAYFVFWHNNRKLILINQL